MPTVQEICREMVEAARRLDDLRFTPGTAGNISARIGANAILISPTGSHMRALSPRDFVKVSLDGSFPTRGKPSSELEVHARIYRERPDVGAVLHAHPPACVGIAMARFSIGEPCNYELYTNMGRPQLVPFGPPGETGDALAALLKKGECFFLSNHGVLTLGPTLHLALHRIENLENFAAALVAAKALGGAKPFSREELAAIHGYMARMGMPVRA